MHAARLALAAALLTIACASGGATPGAAPSPAVTPASVARHAPERVGEFVLLGRRNIQGSPDVQLRYRAADALEVDAFVYPSDPAVARCGASCADSAARAEAAGEEPMRAPAGAAWLAGYRVTLDVEREFGAGRSDFLLYLLPDYRVKVRATYPERAGAPARIAAFSDELLRVLPAATATAP